MYKPKSKCCNAPIRVEVENELQQHYECSKCGKECKIANDNRQEANKPNPFLYKEIIGGEPRNPLIEEK